MTAARSNKDCEDFFSFLFRPPDPFLMGRETVRTYTHPIQIFPAEISAFGLHIIYIYMYAKATHIRVLYIYMCIAVVSGSSLRPLLQCPKMSTWVYTYYIMYIYMINNLYMSEIYARPKYLAITQYYFSRRKKKPVICTRWKMRSGNLSSHNVDYVEGRYLSL